MLSAVAAWCESAERLSGAHPRSERDRAIPKVGGRPTDPIVACRHSVGFFFSCDALALDTSPVLTFGRMVNNLPTLQHALEYGSTRRVLPIHHKQGTPCKLWVEKRAGYGDAREGCGALIADVHRVHGCISSGCSERIGIRLADTNRYILRRLQYHRCRGTSRDLYS